jgi:hypothetical protein
MRLEEQAAHEQVVLVALRGLMARLDLETSAEEMELLEPQCGSFRNA